MQADIIRQVRDAEMRAEQKITDAKAQADALLRDARHQAGDARGEILETARQQAKELFERGVQEFAPELASLSQTFEAEIARDAKHAHQSLETAVNFVVTKFYDQFTQE